MVAGTDSAEIVGNPMQQDMDNQGNPLVLAQKLCVKQEFAVMELCGIEARNCYHICVDQPDPEGGRQAFFVSEASDPCERICCPPGRSYVLSVHLGYDKSGPVLLTLEKALHCPMMPWPMLLNPGAWPCVCPLLCAAGASKPEMVVIEGNQELGRVVDPPSPLFCCKMDSIVKDKSGGEIFHLGPKSLCSSGMVCACCDDVVVPVTRGGREVAQIVRSELSCGELCKRTNRFEIRFGEVSDLTERKLLMGAAFLMDTQYWDAKR